MTKSQIKTIIVSAAVVLAVCNPATAAAQCGHYKALKKALMERAKEQPIASGIGPGGFTSVEIFVSEKGTFTVLNRFGNSACIAIFGTDFEMLPPPIYGRDG